MYPNSNSRIPTVGSVVSLPSGGEALLKYVGSIQGKEGVFCGLELLGGLRSKGKNNGEVDGNVYFHVETPNSGLFVPLRKLQSWFPLVEVPPVADIYQQRIMKSELDLKEMSLQLDEVEQNMRIQEDQWMKKESKFNLYKQEKELEITQLIETINVLNQKVKESEEKFIKLNVDSSGDNGDDTEKFQSLLNEEKDKFTQFKTKMNKQVDDLRKVEMDNYKLELKIEEQDKEITQLKEQLESNKQIKVPPVSLVDENNTLKIFQPLTKIDASYGDINFCTFCDKQGHSRLECPYENDDDDMDQF